MRDVVIRRGIVKVMRDFKHAAGLDDRGLERVFAAGGGPPLRSDGTLRAS